MSFVLLAAFQLNMVNMILHIQKTILKVLAIYIIK